MQSTQQPPYYPQQPPPPSYAYPPQEYPQQGYPQQGYPQHLPPQPIAKYPSYPPNPLANPPPPEKQHHHSRTPSPAPPPQQIPNAIALIPSSTPYPPTTIKLTRDAAVDANDVEFLRITTKGRGSSRELTAIANGSPLFALRHHRRSTPDWTLHAPNGSEILSAVSHRGMRSSTDISFVNAATGAPATLSLHGHGWGERRYTVECAGREMASMEAGGFGGKKLTVNVTAGFDGMLAAGLGMIVMERRRARAAAAAAGAGA